VNIADTTTFAVWMLTTAASFVSVYLLCEWFVSVDIVIFVAALDCFDYIGFQNAFLDYAGPVKIKPRTCRAVKSFFHCYDLSH